MKYCKTLLIYLFLTLSLTTSAFAANISVTVSKNRLVKNEVFQLKVVVDEKVDSDAIDFTPLEQDFYLGRPNFGTSLNIINGSRSSFSEWNLSLAPQKLGLLTIPPLTIDGVSSEPIQLQVTMDEEEPKASDLIELQSSLSVNQLYPSQSATLQTTLIIKTNPRQLQNPQITPPQATGLAIETLDEPNQYQSVIDGVPVTIVEQAYRVTAEEEGEYTLLSIGFKGSAAYRSNSTNSTKLVSVVTAPEQFTMHVKPVPQSFDGAWLPTPNLDLKQRWLDGEGNVIELEQYSLKLGDSLTREITLDIQDVPMERFPDISVSYPSSVRLYQEKPQFSPVNHTTTRMTIKQVLIAQQLGATSLQAIDLPWWNSQSDRQENAHLDGLTLNIEQGELLQTEAIPTQPANNAAVKTVTDSGIWPYLTALFATLWLATLILWQRSNAKSASIEESSTATSSTQAELLQALQQGDRVRSNYLFTQWLDEHKHVSEEGKQLIKKELLKMNTAEYSSDSGTWDPSHLVKLIQKLSSNKVNSTKKLGKLANL